jgi:hypothetical protein
VQDRLKLNINITPNFMAMMTGHGKTRAYLHQFRIKEKAECSCKKKGDQTIDHLINQCALLQQHREILGNSFIKCGKWPVSKSELIMKHLKAFLRYTESIDFEQL